MALADDLDRIAAHAAAHGAVTGVLAAEPALGLRLYLVALGDGEEERRWVVLDDAGTPVSRREDVRDVASIVVMCELAEELTGREVAAARVATPAYLDEVGVAPEAIRGAVGLVDEFVQDVQRSYALPLP
jgi:hypothetical protein